MTTGRTGWLVTTTTTGGTELSLPTSAGSWWTTGLVWTFPARTRRAAISVSVRSTSPASPSVYGQSCTGTGAGSGTPLSGEGTVTTLNSSKGRVQSQFQQFLVANSNSSFKVRHLVTHVALQHMHSQLEIFRPCFYVYNGPEMQKKIEDK